MGYQYSGASGPLPGIPYSTTADEEGNVRAASRPVLLADALALQLLADRCAGGGHARSGKSDSCRKMGAIWWRRGPVR